MKKIILSIVLVGAVTGANAWGPREQGVLAGAAGLWAVEQLAKPQQVIQQPTYVMPPPIQAVPVYVYPVQQPTPAPVYGNVVTPMVAYYCESARLYYPYVHSCNEGWKIFPTN